MIKLYLNGKAVSLYTDTNIGITAMNPYFNEIGSYSYPFAIPYKPNEAVLLHAARIQSTILARNFIWDAILEVDGIQFLIGEAVAEGDFAVREGSFPIVLRSGKTSFAKQSEIVKMNEMEFGTEPNTSRPTIADVRGLQTNTLNEHYPSRDYVCAPIYNTDAISDAKADWLIADYINKYDPVKGVLIDMDTDGNTNMIVYSFYVRYILKRTIEIFGYAPGVDDLANSDFDKWFLLSMSRVWRDYNIQYKYCFNAITVRDFLKAIRQFGIVLVVDDRKKTVSIKKASTIFTSPSINSLLDNKFASNATIVMAMPKDGYKVKFKNSEFDNDPITAPIESGATIYTIEDVGDLQTANEFSQGYLYLSAASGLYYSTFVLPKDNDNGPNVYGWQAVGTCRPLVTGMGENEVEFEAVAVGQRWETINVTKTVQIRDEETITKSWDIQIEMPAFNHKVNDYNMIWTKGRKYEDPPLIFLFNWGLKFYANSEDSRITVSYPCISGDCYDRGESKMGTVSMRTQGEESIFTQMVKHEQDWMLVRKQKRERFPLSVPECATFAWEDTYNIESVNYLVNSLKFDITTKGISLVEAELYTV